MPRVMLCILHQKAKTHSRSTCVLVLFPSGGSERVSDSRCSGLLSVVACSALPGGCPPSTQSLLILLVFGLGFLKIGRFCEGGMTLLVQSRQDRGRSTALTCHIEKCTK